MKGSLYLDLRELNGSESGRAFAQTVRDNIEGYTKREVEAAALVRKARIRVGCAPPKEFANIVSQCTLGNTPFTPLDLQRADAIFGPDVPNLKANSVRDKPTRVEVEVLPIPRDYYTLNNFVTLTADVMFVNEVPFLTTLSRRIRLFTVEHLSSRSAKQLSSSLNKVIQYYKRANFIVNVILMDQEFDKVVDELPMVEINTSAAREHVGEIERGIRTIKGRCRGVIATLKYAVLPRQVVIHLIYFVVMWLNNTPNKLGISEKWSPRKIMTKTRLTWDTHCKADFGCAVEARGDYNTTNNQVERTFTGVYLGPTGNRQGTVKVFDIATGKVKKPRKITPFPMPDSFIATVNKWGRRNQKEAQRARLEFQSDR